MMPSLANLFSNKKIVFLDMDGTIYLGDELIHGAQEFLRTLNENGLIHYYLSNNSSRSKKDYVEKLTRLGIPAREEEIILSTDGVIDFLHQKDIRDAYVVGTESMKEMFVRAGIDIDSPRPHIVILGFDTELDYEKIRRASLLLHQGVELIATHCDIVCPTPEGPIPDVGAMLAMFEKATQKKAARVFGKPNAEMLEHIIRQHGAAPHDLVIIGDRIYTDMEMARRIGCDFILVLSGETRREDIQNLENQPALVVDDIGYLLQS